MELNDKLRGPGVLLSRGRVAAEAEGSPIALPYREPTLAPYATVDTTEEYEYDSGIGEGHVIQSTERDATTEGRVEDMQEILIDPLYEDLEALDKAQGAIFQDPASAERPSWRDPVNIVEREIWRPGDGDGDRNADYYDMLGPKPPPEKRWKFFQSRVGPGPIKSGHNEPPKYVILDDRAAQELLASDFPKTHLPKYWSHDFAGNGSIRARRLNRGRGAIGDFEADGIDRFHFATVGNKKNGEKYYFKGGQDYKPIIWTTADVHLAIGVFKPEVKKITSPPPPRRLKHNQSGHNQWTPRDELVKFGAKHRNAHPRKPRVLDEGEVRGGRNRNHNFMANHIPTAQERVEDWRSTMGPVMPSSSDRGRRETSDNNTGGSGRKRARRSSSEEGDEAAYVQQLEMYLVSAKEVADEQNVKVDCMKDALKRAREKIRKLEEERATSKQDYDGRTMG